MKKTLIAMLALTCAAMSAQAKSITLNDESFGGRWLWVYEPEATKWKYLADTSTTALIPYGDHVPSQTADPCYFNYSFSYVDGKQILTSSTTSVEINSPAWLSTQSFIGDATKIKGSSNGFWSGTKIDFANISTSSFQYGDFWKQGDLYITGAITLNKATQEYTFFTATNMDQNSGTWDASGFEVTDANGVKLTYAAAGSENVGKDGYFWVDAAYTAEGSTNFSAKLVAKEFVVPEPTTATLSLLALAGLAARRRRR